MRIKRVADKMEDRYKENLGILEKIIMKWGSPTVYNLGDWLDIYDHFKISREKPRRPETELINPSEKQQETAR